MVILKTHGNRTIELSEVELMMLNELLIHRSLSGNQLYDFVSVLKPRSKKGFVNRLAKLTDYGILLRYKHFYSVESTLYRFHYKLGRKGLQLLSEQGIITSEEVELLFQSTKSIKVPRIHTQAISHVAITTKLALIKENLNHIEHCRGADDKRTAERTNGELVPDWIFRNKNRTVYIEMDTGSQRGNKIPSKVKRYIELARNNPSEETIVVFSVLDNSINISGQDRFGYDRSKRVSGVKNTISPKTEWPSNLFFYVLSAHRTPQAIMKFMKNELPVLPSHRIFELYSWQEELASSLKQWKVEDIDGPVIYGEKEEVGIEAELLLKITNPSYVKKSVAVIYGEEGSVHTHQQISAHYLRTKGQFSKGKRLDDIWVVYGQEEEMEEEVYGEHWETVWLLSLNRKVKQNKPSFLRVISAFRKEEMDYE